VTNVRKKGRNSTLSDKEALETEPNRDAFHLNFRNGKKFTGKDSRKPETVEFPKSKPLNQKFWKFQDENQIERKFPGKSFRKFGYTSGHCPLLPEVM